MALTGQDIGFDSDEELVEGDYAEFIVDVDKPDGTDKDLSAGSAKWAMAKSFGDDPELTESSNGVSVSITDAAAGEVTITLESGATQGLADRWVHEVEIQDSAGKKVTTTRGKIKIKSGIID